MKFIDLCKIFNDLLKKAVLVCFFDLSTLLFDVNQYGE